MLPPILAAAANLTDRGLQQTRCRGLERVTRRVAATALDTRRQSVNARSGRWSDTGKPRRAKQLFYFDPCQLE